jgi:hypothetical protein
VDTLAAAARNMWTLPELFNRGVIGLFGREVVPTAAKMLS